MKSTVLKSITQTLTTCLILHNASVEALLIGLIKSLCAESTVLKYTTLNKESMILVVLVTTIKCSTLPR